MRAWILRARYRLSICIYPERAEAPLKAEILFEGGSLDRCLQSRGPVVSDVIWLPSMDGPAEKYLLKRAIYQIEGM